MGIMKQWSTNIKENRQLLQGFDTLNVASMVADDTPIEEQFSYVKNEGSSEGPFSGIKEIFGKFKTTISSFVNSIKTFMESETFQKIKSSLTQLGTALGDLVSNILDFLTKVFESEGW